MQYTHPSYVRSAWMMIWGAGPLCGLVFLYVALKRKLADFKYANYDPYYGPKVQLSMYEGQDSDGMQERIQMKL